MDIAKKKTRATWVWIAIGIVLVFGGFLTIGVTKAELSLTNAFTGGWLLLWVGVIFLAWTLVPDRATFRGFLGTWGLSIAFVGVCVSWIPPRGM